MRSAGGEDAASLENAPENFCGVQKLVWFRGEARIGRGKVGKVVRILVLEVVSVLGAGGPCGTPRAGAAAACLRCGAEEMMDFGDCISSGRAGGSAGRCGREGG